MSNPILNGYWGNFLPGLNVSIPASSQLSNAFALKGFSLVGLILPSIFTGTAMTFEVGDSIDGFQANGEILFGSNPAAADTLTIHGVALTFRASSPGALEILIGADATETMANLQAFLDATANASLLACTYTSSGTLMTVTAKVHGTAGNAYTFAKSSSHITLTPSGGTLSGGGFRALYDASNAEVSMTVAAGRAYAVDPANFQGFGFMKLKSGSSEANARTVVCTLRGF